MKLSPRFLVRHEKQIALGCVSGLVLLLSGCASGKKEIGLLGPRPLTVPPAYIEPTPALPATPVIPQEPVLAEPEVAAAAKEVPEPAVKTIVLPPKVESKVITYKVAPGDSLWKIAWMYNVSLEELAANNNLKLKESLKIGQTLNIPPGGHFIPLSKRPLPKPKVVAKKPAAERTTSTAGGGDMPAAGTEPIPADGKYIVQKNDNLWTIARKFGVHSADIRTASGLKNDALQIGQELIIPTAAGTTATPAATDTASAPVPETAPTTPVPSVGAATAVPPTTEVAVPPTGTGATAFPNSLEHTVLEGETLESIAEMYETKAEDILKANLQIKGNRDLKPNMTIMVPYK